MTRISSLFIVTLFLTLMPISALAEFPYTTNQLGQHGAMGVGGKGTNGGEGGDGGVAGHNDANLRNGQDGKDGDPYIPNAGDGGNGGRGTLKIRDMAPDEAFVNQGILKLGGYYGAFGDAPQMQRNGGNGGDGGGVLCIPAAGKGEEPYPDVGGTQGGVAGTLTSEGGAGTDGGGGGGGRCSAPFVGGGHGGNGGDGKDGADGAGGTGASGAREEVVMTVGYTNPPDQTLQLGGNGGKGGQHGQKGGGGGGGGGAGEYWGKARGAGGKGAGNWYQYPYLTWGGQYAGGSLVLSAGGRLINQGVIKLGGTVCDYRGDGSCALSGFTLEQGGTLVNDYNARVEEGAESWIIAAGQSSIVNNGTLKSSLGWCSADFSGAGIVDGNARLSGKFMPGDPIGFQTITGYYDTARSSTAGTLQIEIAGIDHTIPEYDYVQVGGQVKLKNESVLEVVFASGFNEADLVDGDYFDIIRYSSSNTVYRGAGYEHGFGIIEDSQAPLWYGIWSLSYDEYVDIDTNSVRLTYHKIKTCICDLEPDDDVDGCDLAEFIKDNRGIAIATMAAEFGGTGCLLYANKNQSTSLAL